MIWTKLRPRPFAAAVCSAAFALVSSGCFRPERRVLEYHGLSVGGGRTSNEPLLFDWVAVDFTQRDGAWRETDIVLDDGSALRLGSLTAHDIADGEVTDEVAGLEAEHKNGGSNDGSWIRFPRSPSKRFYLFRVEEGALISMYTQGIPPAPRATSGPRAAAFRTKDGDIIPLPMSQEAATELWGFPQFIRKKRAFSRW